jgi:hypothetical protein
MKVSTIIVFGVLCLVPANAVAAEKGDGPGSEFNADVHLNLLGPLQFGITPTVELGGKQVAGLLRFRWMNPGLLSQGLPNQDYQELAFSYGAALGGRYYLHSGLSGIHLGIWAEYIRTRIEDLEVEREAYVTSLIVPQAEAGYRWRFGRAFVGLGAALGYAVAFDKRTEDLSEGADPVLQPVDFGSTIFGSGAFDVGYFF